MKDCGCSPEDAVLVEGWCYFHLKITAGLLGYNRNGYELSDEQRAFIGAVESRRVAPRPDPWEALLRGLDTEPVEPWERTVGSAHVESLSDRS